MAKSWEDRAFESAVGLAKKRAGTGWDMIGPELREALVAREVMSVLAAAATIENTPQGRLASMACR